MLQFKSILFTVLLAAGALSQGEDSCPNRATECPDNCGGAQCPRFLNAECQVNPCHGLCTPNFIWRGRNVTDKCSVERCVDKECSGIRQCVEEIEPPSCPGTDTKCRQYIRTRCIVPPPATNCSQITCGPGMYCREKKRGKGVKCAIARNCNQLTCSEGLSCMESVDGPVCTTEEKPTSRPSPMTTSTPTVSIATPFPNFCDYCASIGQVCSVVNGSYQCTEPTKCDAVRIDYCLNTLGRLCKEVNGTATCDFAASCSEIDCPHGTECLGFGFGAFCNRITEAETCDQLNCEAIPGQVCEQRNDSAVCVVGCSADFIEICASAQARCEVVDGFPECVLDIQQTCDEVVCTEGNTCLHTSFPSRDFSLAVCIPLAVTDTIPTLEDVMCPASLIPGCPESNFCTDIFQDGLFVSPSCNNFTSNCSDDASCALNETCLDVPNDVDVMFNSLCLSSELAFEFAFEFGGTCASGSKQCSNGFVCLDISLDGDVIGTICGIPSPPDALIASSCAELVPCDEGLECVETFVSGKGGAARCSDRESADVLFNTLMSLFNFNQR